MAKMFKCVGLRVKKSNDLTLKIKLTPSQIATIPSIIKNINQDPEMLMDQLTIVGDQLIMNCHDTYELIEALKKENPIELQRMKRQLKLALDEILKTQTISEHQRKNYLSSSLSIEQI